jgi:WD40 repeat protein
LQHRGLRLAEAEVVLARPDFASAGGQEALDYLRACREAEDRAAAAEALRLAEERRQIKRNRKLQRRGVMLLAFASLAVIVGAAAVLAVVQGLNQRRSTTLAAMARQALNQGFADRAARYAVAGMVGWDAPFVGFDGRDAEAVLRVQAANSGALAALHHDDQVRTVAYSTDGARVLTASFDHTARVWDARTGRLLRTFSGHAYKVEFAAFSNDGRWIVTTSFDGTARIWDANADGPAVHVLAHESGQRRPLQVWKAAFSADGRLIVTAASDGRARMWDATDGRLLGVYSGHNSAVRDVGFAPGGENVISASEDSEVRLWDARTREDVQAFSPPPGVPGGYTIARLTPDGRHLAIGYTNGVIAVWTLATGKMRTLAPAHTQFVYALSFDRQSRRMVSASADRCTRLWDIETLSLVKQWPSGDTCAGESVRDAAFSPDGTRIVAAGDDSTARMFNADTGAMVFEYRGHEGPIWRVAFAPDGRRFATASLDGEARVWDATIRQENVALVLRGHRGRVRTAVFSPDGRHVATGAFDDSDRTARVWDAESGDLLAIIPAGQVQTVAFSPDGSRLATATQDTNRAGIWDWRRCTPEGHAVCLDGSEMQHGNRVMDVGFSPDGRLIVTASRDGRASIWSLEDRQAPRVVFPHRAGLYAVDFAPNGTRVASSSYEDAWIWDARTGADICELKGHTAAIRDIAFAPDGNSVATASEDESVRIWDAQACRLKRLISVRGDSVWSVKFSPDGSEIAVASQRFNNVRIFDAATGSGVALLIGHQGAVFSAAFSPRGGRRVVSASADLTARVWTLPQRDASDRHALVANTCDGRLASGLSLFTDQEIDAAPALDPVLDRDPCRPASLWIRSRHIFEQSFWRRDAR